VQSLRRLRDAKSARIGLRARVQSRCSRLRRMSALSAVCDSGRPGSATNGTRMRRCLSRAVTDAARCSRRARCCECTWKRAGRRSRIEDGHTQLYTVGCSVRATERARWCMQKSSVLTRATVQTNRARRPRGSSSSLRSSKTPSPQTSCILWPSRTVRPPVVANAHILGPTPQT
jgi:hypothetical protein